MKIFQGVCAVRWYKLYTNKALIQTCCTEKTIALEISFFFFGANLLFSQGCIYKSPPKPSNQFSRLWIKGFRKFKIARQKKIQENRFSWGYPFHLNNLRFAWVPNATYQIWKRWTKRFIRCSAAGPQDRAASQF